MPNLMPTPMWLPLSAREFMNDQATLVDHELGSLHGIGRLAPGRHVDEAAAELSVLARQLDLTVPTGRRRDFQVFKTADVRMDEQYDRIAIPVGNAATGAIVLVLLLACGNLAMLTLAHGARRRHERAIRQAVGASRRHLIGEQFLESALVAAIGGTAGVVVARLLMTYLGKSISIGNGFVLQAEPLLDRSALAVAVGATGVALLIFGLVPAIRLTRVELNPLLTAEGATVFPQWRGRQWFVVAQVAISVVLLGLAALCVQQVRMASQRDTGMTLDRLAIAVVDFTFHNIDEEAARRTLDTILQSIATRSRVAALAVASGLPVGVFTPGAWLTPIDKPFSNGVDGERVELLASSPAIFQTLGVTIRRGRAIGEEDSMAAPAVAVVSQLAARRLFDTDDILGREILFRRQRWAGDREHAAKSLIVVGVAADTDVGTVGRRNRGVVYLPFAQHFEPRVAILARANEDPSGLAAGLRTTIARAAPDIAVIESGTGTALGGAEDRALQITAHLSGWLGLMALLLSITGLYGALSDVVARRGREIGIRAALGASAGRITRLILVEGIRPVMLGTIAGLVLVMGIQAVLRPMVFGLLPTIDPVVLGVVALAFVAVALVACYVPARRAARLDPTEILKAS